jgi:hypothetical protein
MKKNTTTFALFFLLTQLSGIAWQGDGFYYSKYPTPDKGKELTAKAEFGKLYC